MKATSKIDIRLQSYALPRGVIKYLWGCCMRPTGTYSVDRLVDKCAGDARMIEKAKRCASIEFGLNGKA